MISKDKDLKLIKIYYFVCEKYEELKFCCERFTNNNKPDFTDQEIISIYLFVIQHEQKFKIKQIHKHAREHLKTWFPKLNSYQAFNRRLNRLSEVFKKLSEIIISEFQPNDCILDQSLMDSMPIITCSGKRKAKVAKEITNKGYCSTKGLYYYGIKLHLLGYRRKGTIPFPEQIVCSKASENDVSIFKSTWSEIRNRIFFADKIYFIKALNQNMIDKYNSEILAPVKAVKGMDENTKMRIKAADELYSTAVSVVRQPVESFFNWIIEKTDIQRASKVRSSNGLLVHIFGKVATAFIELIF